MLPSFPSEAAEKLLAAAEEAGVERAMLRPDPDRALDYPELAALYERAAELARDPAFGLHVGERTSERTYGLLGYAAAHSGTLGEALRTLVELQHVWSEAAGLAMEHRGALAAIRYWHSGDVLPDARRHESEQMMATLVGFVRRVLAGPAAPAEVRFEHCAPEDMTEYERIFAAPVRFMEPATEILFDSALLGEALPEADVVLGGLIRGQAEAAVAARRKPETMIEALRTSLREDLAENRAPSLDSAARALGIGPRTLQRRLAEQGATFGAIADEARVEAARGLLRETRLSLAEIAFRLGYSQTSAFHRAFRRIAGATPGRFRAAREPSTREVVPRGGIEPPTP